MSGLILERARANHEDVEAYEAAIVAILEDKPRTNKERVYQQHRIHNLITQIQARSKDLASIYEDTDAILKEEVAALRGREAFPNFYQKLDQAREYHQKHPHLPIRHHPDVQREAEPTVAFSGEEVYGKYLDLQALHTQFYALPQTPKVDYQTYLSRFVDLLAEVPFQQKKKKGYTLYLHSLLDYLTNFLLRTQPLLNPKTDLHNTPTHIHTFQSHYQAGTLPVGNWPPPPQSQHTHTHTHTQTGPRPVDLKKFHTPTDLEALGMERLKEGLMALGLKCGGTLTERAQRLFSTKGKKKEEIDKKLWAKQSKNSQAHTQNGSGGGSGGSGEGGNPQTDTDAGAATTGEGEGEKEGEEGEGNGNGASMSVGVHEKVDKMDATQQTAWLEYQIYLLRQALAEVVTNTERFALKKQTRTKEEREAELREEEEGVLPEVKTGAHQDDASDDDDDDEDGPIYNPLNLPLGYDGKPIPYWLYKLHGLGVEYKCEICGNFSYWGRRAFDRHFQEWRHAHGMRCLKIPNTKHFHDIVKIEDAQALYGKLKGQVVGEVWEAEVEEEFEDSEGNVLNRRTFEDLARQGLL